MGAYLSEPITEKISTDQAGKHILYGASSMQGWRMTQEDAHNSCIDFDDNVSLFAVYDGHGGHEVAYYCSKNLPNFIKNTEAYKRGDMKEALIEAFLGFDATLATPEVISTLKEIAGNKGQNRDNDESDVEENVSDLYKEASMPLQAVMAKYQAEALGFTPNGENFINKNFQAGTANFASPFLRSRKNKPTDECGASSGASCSSSSASWNTNEADVSSSSQIGTSTANETNNAIQAASSSESDQVLDSTTTNGDSSHDVGSTNDAEVSTKSGDIPDSSEDVKDASPSKTKPQSLNQTSEVSVNGAADSSKGGDNVSSSSNVTLEKGEAEQQEKISSTEKSATKNSTSEPKANSKTKKDKVKSFRNLLSEDYDDDDENDKSFKGGVQESDDEEEEDGEDDDTEDDLEEDENEEEEDDEDDDEDDEDGENDDEVDMEDDFSMKVYDEPGFDSGCTAVVALLKGNDLYVANAGDSRCVLCRDGEAVELSLDHKPEDEPEMMRIIRAGGKVTGDGRVNGGLNLSRALGDHAYKQNKELPAKDQMISALPDIRHCTLDPVKDEFMILACDGIWNFMSSQNVVNFIRERLKQNTENISKICEELFDHCLAPNTLGDGTGCDNMTAIIVRFRTSKNGNEVATEVTSATKRKPPSPNTSTEDDCNGEEKIQEECKRQKTDGC